ncbi:FAD-dependent oxidoreductase [Cellulomonas dongxiuzhuiae]|uniref:FAD-dependent oxidoreductase n=1 Tax=Cellulomonas dongxiuzhuiae TaxID=2819979 RepID=A0ABX8GF92_9CELL|nr:FAD-dependent oxidoreductase [Cellulomonas dongxiuzhuiae]QWC14640.1 FAD-dependent oxidoreductase [Cellulomonas dongxiuzhuiae]
MGGAPVSGPIPPQVDVLVVGGGLAGHAAALAAAEDGAVVLQVEKQPVTGGSTVLSAGLSAFAGTDEQAEAGVQDSVTLLHDDILATGFHKNDPRLVDLYCSHQAETYRWLKALGVRYGNLHAAAGQSVPRSHPTDTRRMLDLLASRAAELGVQLRTGVRAQHLVREHGRVVGAVLEASGTAVEVRAGSTVLASGGFARDRALLDKFAPQMALALQAGGAGNVGDGLRMAWQLGADVIDTPFIKGTYGIYPLPHDGEHGTGIHAIYKGGIAVNVHGKRFVDESLPYKVVGDANLAQPDGRSVQLFDSRVLRASDAAVPIFDFEGRRDSGILVEADTVEELAAAMGLDVAATAATVAEYNRRIRTGEHDELGRVHLSGGVGEIFPLVEPPFYGHLSGTVVLATYCGLVVDRALRVHDVLGDPIDGLYAAGEIVGGFHGAGYMTGTSIGKAGIFGRLAGRSAAAAASGVPR